jgi:hypothetical protein
VSRGSTGSSAAVRRGIRGSRRAPAFCEAPKRHLPDALTSFIGREREVAKATALFGEHRCAVPGATTIRQRSCSNDEIEHHGARGDRWLRAAAVADTAEAEERRGNIARAETLARQGLDLAEDVETPAVAWNLDVLARALAGRGLVIEAARRALGSVTPASSRRRGQQDAR